MMKLFLLYFFCVFVVFFEGFSQLAGQGYQTLDDSVVAKKPFMWPQPKPFDGCLPCQNSVFDAAPGGCNAPECVIYDLTSQAVCTIVENEQPTNDDRWKAGLNVNVDQTILGGRIAAFQLQWFGGGWSQWFVPGVNDIDIKLNMCGMRRWWSYFYDHTHTYIICKEK